MLREIAQSVALDHGVSTDDIRGKSRTRPIAYARHTFFWRAMMSARAAKPHVYTVQRIGEFCECSHASVLYGVARYAERHGTVNPSNFDLTRRHRRYRATRQAALCPGRPDAAIELIKAAVALQYNITPAEIDSSSRDSYLVIARHEAILRAHERFGNRLSSAALGGHFGGREGSTVLHAIKRARERRERLARGLAA